MIAIASKENLLIIEGEENLLAIDNEKKRESRHVNKLSWQGNTQKNSADDNPLTGFTIEF